MKSQSLAADICIIGGGLAGQTAAIALANEGFNIITCAPAQTHPDRRTTAILLDSMHYLQKLDVWDALKDVAHPLKTMRIVDGTDRLFRIPQVDFQSSEIDIEAFGYNVQNSALEKVLALKIAEHKNITTLECSVSELTPKDGLMQVIAESSDREISIDAGFVVGADGKNSLVRASMGAGQREWSYPQTAIVLDIEHQFSTRYISTEFHTKTGPFTIVPRSNHTAGIVWMETPERASELVNLSKPELSMVLERKMQSFLGEITILTDTQAFPLSGMIARRFGRGNWALIGEAAHAFPPIGAQGFNLGIRDIKALAETLGRFTTLENRGDEYSKARSADINLRTIGVDILNRSLISDFMPMHLLRGAGLHALSSWPVLRKSVMKMGISPEFRNAATNL